MEEKNPRLFSDAPAGEAEAPLEQGAGEQGTGKEKEAFAAGDTGETGAPLTPEKLQAKFAALEQEKNTVENRLLRLQADFDNYRKRARQEKEEMIGLANFVLIQKLLPVIDNLDRALAALQEAPAGMREGLEAIKKHFLEVLQQEGVALIESVGQPFDPRFHEAVLREEGSDHPPDTVVAELQKGYIMHQRVLRASKVQVSVE
ncbi:MAG: nucleotide exchange factor GrpE [Dethiobacteria bacterium]